MANYNLRVYNIGNICLTLFPYILYVGIQHFWIQQRLFGFIQSKCLEWVNNLQITDLSQ